jgi:hypothetical protein
VRKRSELRDAVVGLGQLLRNGFDLRRHFAQEVKEERTAVE